MRSSLVIVIALVACGPMAGHEAVKNPEGAGSGSAATKPGSAGDVTADVPPYEIKGVVFDPEAMYVPAMMLYEPKKKTTLDKQRKVFDTTKDAVQKEAQAAVLATLLYEKAKDEKDDAAKKPMFDDARKALMDAATNSGGLDKADEVTLQLLGRYTLLLDDYAASEQDWAALVNKLPKDKEVHSWKAWWAYTLLRQYKNADALNIVKDEPLTEKQPELAYVAAWAKFRTGDEAGAWQAILTAAKGWGALPGKDVLDRDVLLFAGRTGTTVQDAIKELTPLYAKGGPDQKYDLYAKMGLQAYKFAGRWADAITVLNKALEVIGNKVPPKDLVVMRYEEADYTVRLDDPVAAAKLSQQAIDALPGCGSACSAQENENLVEGVYVMARLFHILYATSNDIRYYQPAHDLYAISIPKIQDQAKRTEAEKDSGILEATFKTMKVGTGTHDKQALGALLSRHNQEAQACYEVALGGNPKLTGTVSVTIEADQTGTIKGAATEPKAGLADLAQVAGCIAERAKTWKLTKVPHPITTRLKLGYTFSVRTDVK